MDGPSSPRSGPAEEVSAEIARVAADLARIASADEASELPLVLAHYRYAEDLDFLEYAVIASDVAGMEESHASRRAVVALLKRLGDAQRAARARDD